MVAPAAPGGDRGQGVVAQVPVQLAGQALVDIVDIGAGVGVDVAVVAGAPDRVQRIGEGRGQGLADHAVGRVVVGLHVVGGEGEFHVFVGGELQLAAYALVVVAVDFLAVGLVLDVAVIAAEQGGQRAFQGLWNQAAADAETGTAFVAAVVRLVDVAVGLGGRGLGDDVQYTGRGILAEQRALRAAQHFDAVEVEQVEGGLAGTAVDHAVDHRGHGGLDPRRGGNGAHATDEQRGVLVRSAGAEVQRRHLLDDAGDAVATVALQLFALDHRDRHRDFLQRFLAPRGGDGDRLQRRLLVAAGVGGKHHG